MINRYSLQNLKVYLLWVLSVLVLASIAWGTWERIQFSYDGVRWSNRSGFVTRVDATGPAAGLLEKGDRILAIDGKPISQVTSLYSDKQPGHQVTFSIERNEARQNIAFQLSTPPWKVMFITFAPLMVALIFWITGNILLIFQQDNFLAQFYAVICHLGGSLLSMGSISLVGPPAAKILFYILLWWMTPLLFHFHLLFPVTKSTRSLHVIRTSLYAIAALGSSLDLGLMPAIMDAGFAYNAFYFIRRMWLALGFIGVVFLLIPNYREGSGGESRSQVGVVALGGALALIAFVSFTLLPEVLFDKAILPYEVAFIFLAGIPVSYGYAILRYRLIPLERYVNRGITTALLFTLLSGLYLVLYTVLVQRLPSPLWEKTIVNMILVLLMAGVFGPLHRRLQRFVNFLFYGGWYDYQSAVKQISQRLEPVSDEGTFSQSLIREIQAAMQLECTCILLFDGRESRQSQGLVCRSCQSSLPDNHQSTPVKALSLYFQKHPAPVGSQALRQDLGEMTLSRAESELLACRKARLWMPLKSSGQINGLLILGVRRGGGGFTASDLEILEVISRQASIALDNMRLVSQLYDRDAEQARLHQQALRAGEIERKRLARELHDQIIQSLVGLNFQLADVRRYLDPEFKNRLDQPESEMRAILARLRSICADLRPPAMDSLGLVAVVHSQVRTINETAAFRTTLEVDGDERTELPEEVITCTYRVLQEALLNADRHSEAQRVHVKLDISPERLILAIEDDGKGFIVPERLGQLSAHDHFGLLGMYERVELVNGMLEIQSRPGQGCQVTVGIPLLQKEMPSLDTA